MITVSKPNATLITQGIIPWPYRGLNWTNGNYLNVSIHPTSGYPVVCASGTYVAWFNTVFTIQTSVVNNTFTLNSCLMAAGWADVQLTIVGFNSTTQLNTITISLNIFTPSGTGYLDVGIDNLYVTF